MFNHLCQALPEDVTRFIEVLIWNPEMHIDRLSIHLINNFLFNDKLINK
ncbi:hypothetical protein EPYR_00327 [Erwinia pyrifoliae DSM 12163]|nr:hypothetical protein EPYR_00327 [Erwinia pyrifoliae DSM 12163]